MPYRFRIINYILVPHSLIHPNPYAALAYRTPMPGSSPAGRRHASAPLRLQYPLCSRHAFNLLTVKPIRGGAAPPGFCRERPRNESAPLYSAFKNPIRKAFERIIRITNIRKNLQSAYEAFYFFCPGRINFPATGGKTPTFCKNRRIVLSC